MKEDSKIYIAGHRGLVGSAIWKILEGKGYTNLIGRKSSELDLRDSQAVAKFFADEKPEYVYLAAAKVGGIVANNTYRADFIYENLMIQNNVIHQAFLHNVKKLLFLGSTCIYPREAPQPMPENSLLTSPLEYTNEPYAIAKIAGIKMCESYNIQYGTNYLSVMPTNLYGPNDNFNLETSHVLPALIRKIHLGKCLEKGNWEAIRKDMEKRPIEGVGGDSREEEILAILNKYGVKLADQEILRQAQDDITSTSSTSTSSVTEGENSSLVTRHSLPNKVLVEIWGSGKPMREFLWSEEMADACIYVMEKVDFKDVSTPNQEILRQVGSADLRCAPIQDDKVSTGSAKEDGNSSPDEIRNTHINIGTGKEVSIKQVADLIKAKVGFKGQLYFNTSKPDGTMKKLTDPSKINALGWKHSIEIEEGIERMYEWYTTN